MIKVSVIVPVYNVYDYLERCLNSLVNQTLKELEIIIVDDGSPDDSYKIIEKYTKKYQNIKAYKKENGGLSSARNYGLKYATGEYIAFVDSDDYIESNMYQEMYDKAKSHDFDMVVSDLYYIYPDKKVKASSNLPRDIFEKKDVKEAMLNIYPAAWNKIYKSEMLKKSKIKFKEGVWYEDVEFLYRLFPYLKTIGVVSKPFYNYVQRSGAITSTYDERLLNYIDNFNGILDFYKDKGFYNEYKMELEYNYVRYLYATLIKNTIYLDKDLREKIVTKAISNVKEHFPNYRKNKYFYKSLKGLYLVTFNRFYVSLLKLRGGLK